MIKLENLQVSGFEIAIRGMRNPMNSWDKSDSFKPTVEEIPCDDCDGAVTTVSYKSGIGPNDLSLMKKLAKAGTDHRKFLRMINVTMDITAPIYWWKEFDTYKIGTVRNSCSTMHKIHEKEFTFDDFSVEHLIDDSRPDRWSYKNLMKCIIDGLNDARKRYIKTKDKRFWWQMIQLLPSSYNQRATVQLNYEVLLNMYHSRKNHKLDEWRTFCEQIKKLPYLEEFIDD